MSRTILIVDDSKVERVILNGFLRTEYAILEAESGEEAIELLRKKSRSVSAIIMDVVMPGMGGFETLKAIKLNAAWLQIPVIITTALDDDDSREMAITCGADNFVTKPFNRALLMHIVGNAIRLRETAAIANTLWRDPLTGLLNSASFFSEAARMIQRHEAGYYILSCFDVESFKIINDQYGVEKGDEVLKHIARCLSGFVSGINGLACHYSADTFAILYPAQMKDHKELMENHQAAMLPACINRSIRIRIGRYLVTDRSLPVSAMFDRAAMAARTIKGRFDVYIAEYAESMRDNLLHEQHIVTCMTEALQNGEFEPWFQPQYNHATGAMIGSEALVRWRRDGLIIPPNDFIPIFERNGFIYELDQYIWRRVCQLLRRWLDQGKAPLPVSVNISRYDLYQKDFQSILAGLLKEYDLSADLLRLEITESAFADSAKTVIGAAGQLIRQGFTVEIDDFGSGYSSLNTLKDVPASILKLDMRFFEASENSQRGGNIVESVVRMAKWLNMAVIAEGVEQREQADYLKSIGCYYIQGYFYSKPLPLDGYEKLLDASVKEPRISRLHTLATLDNNEFWNPKSMETLIFNSYVGGACIFEFCNGKSELLRANEQYTREMGGLLPVGARLNESSLVRFLDKEGKETLISAIHEAIDQKREASREVRLTSGSHVEYIRMTMRVIARTTERHLLYAVIENTTEQRAAERLARDASERVTAIMNSSQCGITAVVARKDGSVDYLFVNNRFYDLLGYTQAQFRREVPDPFRRIHPEDYQKTVDAVMGLRQVGQTVTLQMRAVRRDQRVIWLRADISIVAFANIPEPVQLSSFLDITEQVEAEKKQLESARQMKAIMGNVNGSVSAIHMDDNGNTTLLFGNDNYYGIYGYTKEQAEAVQLDTMSCIVPEDFEMVVSKLNQLKKDGKPVSIDYRAQKRDGSIVYIRSNSSRMSMEGFGDQVIVSVKTDITETRTLEDQFQAVVDNINGGVSATFLKGDAPEFIIVNNKYYDIIGYTKEQFEAEVPNVFNLVHPDDRARVKKLFGEAAKVQKPYTMEYRLIRRNGAVRHILCNTSVIRLFGVEAPVQLAVSNDITVLREAQQKERRLSQQLQAIMGHIQGGVTATLFHDENNIEIVFSNEGFYQLYGYTKEQLTAEVPNMLDLILPEDRAAAMETVARLVRERGSATYEYRCRKRDGSVMWTRVTNTVISMDGVGSTVLLAVVADVTELHQAETQRLETTDRLRAVMNAMNNGVTAVAFHGDDTEFLFANDRYYEMHGISKDEYEQHTLSEALALVHPDDRDALRKAIRRSADTESRAEIEYRILLPNGTARWTKAVINVTRLAGVNVPVQVTIFSDISAAREAREQLRFLNASMQTLMDDMPGGFSRMEIFPHKPPALVSANDGFARMLGMTAEEVKAAYGDDMYRCLVAADIPSAAADSADAYAAVGQFTTKCRLRRKDGEGLWVTVFGRFVRAEDGRLYLNAYFTDISEKQSAEERQIQLLDNLPTGAALYEYDGKRLTVIHINKRYWQLVNRAPMDYGKASVMDVVHPDDRALVSQEIASAIQQKRDISVYLRILYGTDAYKPYYVTATIKPESNGRHRLFVAYAPVDQQAMSVQELLPIALSTMMSASDDLSYVKDREQRYLCCSDSVVKALGLSSSRDVIGKTDFDLFPRNVAEIFTQRGKEVLAGKALTGLVEQFHVQGDDMRTVSTSSYPIRDACGAIIGLYGVCRDITAQQETESQLKLLTDSIDGGLASYSIRDGDIRLLYCNDGFFKAFGYTRAEYLRLTAGDPLYVVCQEDRARLRALILKFNNSKAYDVTESCTYRCLTKTGGSVWMSMKAVVSMPGENRSVLNVVQLDITEQQEKENRRAALLDNLPVGAALYEFDGSALSTVHINKQYEKLVGRAWNSAVTGAPLDFVHPEDRAVVLDEITDSIAHHRQSSCDIRLLCGDHAYRVFHLDANVTAEENGKHLLYVAYSRVSEQELSLKNLLPYLFSTIMESSTDLTFAKDVNFRYLCCSKTFATLLGLKSEKDVVGKTDYELFDREIADMFRRDDSQLFATEKPQIDILESIPSPDGALHYIRTSKYLLRGANGEIIGVYCVGRDVTETREAYAQLKMLTDSIPGGIATFRCTETDYRLDYFNDGFCGLFDYTREEFPASLPDVMDFIFAEDRPIVDARVADIVRDGTPLNCVYRIRTKGGGYKWVSHNAILAERANGWAVINAVFLDITEQQEEKERLRMAEEEYHIATRHSGHTIGRYDIAAKTLTIAEDTAVLLALPECIPDVPYGRVKLGKISKDTADAYIAFYEKIKNGEKECSVTFKKLLSNGWRWITGRATTLFDSSGMPVSAIISYIDVTDQQEKEVIYSRWQNSLEGRSPDSYTLFRCNLSKGLSFDSWDGSLLHVTFRKGNHTFNDRTNEYAAQCVYAEDREKYRAFLYSDTLLAEYYRGHRTSTLEYREINEEGVIRWLRLTVDLVEYPNSKDVGAYLMYEDIDKQKRAELQTIERAETDPLTGVLNRATFAANVNQLISASKPDARHALLMLDLDGFKLVNDVFGHGAGDQALTDISGLLTKASRKGDLVGRLGGDEFLVFLADIPSEAIAAKKARQICEITRKAYSVDVQISASVGIALYPQDGMDFEALYKSADETLYRVKDSGKNNYAFSGEEAAPSAGKREAPEQGDASKPKGGIRRMLIVDDNKLDHVYLSKLFRDEFKIEEAMDGATALIKLHHYGAAISVVLLDLMMPGMDGYQVLEKIQENPATRSIPVIVVSADEERKTALKVIRAGATDMVTKPVDPDILRIRVESAISKAENERLRAQNSFLAMQSTERDSYRAALEHSGILVITMDWGSGLFTYSPSVSKQLAGRYDRRSFWQILLADMVADAQTVQKLQQLTHDIAEDRERMEDGMTARLKTASGQRRMYEVNVYKEVNNFGLADKLILTFQEARE